MTAAAEGPPDVLELWRAVVPSIGDAPALVDRGTTLSHRDLDRLTDGVADALGRIHPDGTGTVAVVAASGFDATIGMLVALKADLMFCLLDAHLPASVVWTRLDDLAPVAVLGRGTPPSSVDPTRWVDLEVSKPAEAADLQRRPPVPRAPGPASAFFTSGSTGTPKVATAGRDALSRFTHAVADRLGLGPSDRWLQFASPGFDVVLEEVLPVLSRGGAVVCGSGTASVGPELLHEDLRFFAATAVELPTLYWQEYARWLAVTGQFAPLDLRLIVVGGERIDVDAYRAWQGRERTRLVHVYGVTEATCTSTMFDGVVGPEETEVPLGTPLNDVVVSIRDGNHAVPDGTEGEIHICGPLVGTGYLGDPGGTSERFLHGPEGRSYATGDRGVIDERGLLLFRGRVDGQVKVRGHRVELAAVEEGLRTHPSVSAAGVLPDPDDPTTLVAFLVPADSAGLVETGPDGCAPETLLVAEQQDLIDHACRSMPPWEVPGRFCWIARLPRNRHGKLDRDALGRGFGRSRGKTRVPDGGEDRTARLCRLFRDALGVDSVGPDDDFFALGGHSLSAMALVTDIREELGVRGIRPSRIIENPTPARLAEFFDNLGSQRS